MRAISYFRSAAGLTPKHVPVLQPPPVPAWEFAGIQSADRPGEPNPGDSLSARGRFAARQTESNDAQRTVAGNKHPSPERHSLVESGATDRESNAPARTQIRHTPPATPAAHSATSPEPRLEPSRHDPMGQSKPDRFGAENSSRPTLTTRKQATIVGSKPEDLSRGIEPYLPAGSQPAASETKRTPVKTNVRQEDPAQRAISKQESQPPLSAPPPTSSFARFEKLATDSRLKQPVLNLPAEPDRIPRQDPPFIVEKVQSPEPEPNSVRIGRVEIQIAPPVETPRPPSLRPARSTTALSRGFPSWYGFRQG